MSHIYTPKTPNPNPTTAITHPLFFQLWIQIYKEKGASIAAFINEEGEPIVDPTQYETMKTNFAITKAMTAEERKALEIYMMNFE